MLAFEAFFLVPWIGFLATILLTVLFRDKFKLIGVCPLPTILGMLGFYIFAYLYADKFPLSASFWLLLLSISAGIGIYLAITTIVTVYAVKYRHHPERSNKFVFAAVCCMVLYIFSYMLISRHGMKISKEVGVMGYYVTVPENTNTWYFLHHTYSIFYYVPICIEDAMGTASFSWNAPTMQIKFRGQIYPM